jgi:hypothetical protein
LPDVDRTSEVHVDLTRHTHPPPYTCSGHRLPLLVPQISLSQSCSLSSCSQVLHRVYVHQQLLSTESSSFQHVSRPCCRDPCFARSLVSRAVSTQHTRAGTSERCVVGQLDCSTTVAHLAGPRFTDRNSFQVLQSPGQCLPIAVDGHACWMTPDHSARQVSLACLCTSSCSCRVIGPGLPSRLLDHDEGSHVPERQAAGSDSRSSRQ